MSEKTNLERVAEAYTQSEAMEELQKLDDDELRALHRTLSGIQNTIETLLE